MIHLHRAQIVLMVFAVIFTFYYFGIESFPDYKDYLNIARHAGFAVSEQDYQFEWFSRFILSLDHTLPEDRVALLAFFNQLVCIGFLVWMGMRRNAAEVYGTLVFFALFGFMLMTTTLRASAAYFCISVFFLRSARFDFWGIAVLLFSLAWHDSAAPVVVLCLISLVIDRLMVRHILNQRIFFNILKWCVLLGLVFVAFSDLIRPELVSLSDFDIGARAAYFEGDGGYSLAKSVFLMFVILCCFLFVADSGQSGFSRVFITLMVFVLSLFNALNAIMAVRFSFYILAVLLPLRGFLVFSLERKAEFRMASIVFLPVLFGLSAVYTLSNTP